MWPWANSATSPSRPARGRSPGPPARRLRRASRRRASRRPTASSRAAPRGSPASSGPRSRRSRSRRGRDRSRGSKPASRAVSRARARGEASTSANSRPGEPLAQCRARPHGRLGQRDVGARGVLAGRAPLRLAVADQDDLHSERLPGEREHRLDVAPQAPARHGARRRTRCRRGSGGSASRSRCRGRPAASAAAARCGARTRAAPRGRRRRRGP